MNLFTFIESLQPICCKSQIVNDNELEKYNKDFQEKDSRLPNFRGLNDQNGEEDVIQDNENES